MKTKFISIFNFGFAIASTVAVFLSGAKAADCTTAVVNLNVPIAGDEKILSDGNCEATLEISRDDLGSFGTGLTICVHRNSESELVLGVESIPASNEQSRIHLAQLRFQISSLSDVGVTGLVNFFDPTVEPSVPKSAVQIIGTTTIAKQSGETPKVESIVVRTSECLLDEHVMLMKNQKTEVHDEFNVRTENVEGSYE